MGVVIYWGGRWGSQRSQRARVHHPEKGLLQAGRQQDRLGAAQDLRVPDAHRQRGLRLSVVRPSPYPAPARPLGRRGRLGHRARPLVGAQAPGRGRGLRKSQSPANAPRFPDPHPVAPHLLGAPSCAPHGQVELTS